MRPYCGTAAPFHSSCGPITSFGATSSNGWDGSTAVRRSAYRNGSIGPTYASERTGSFRPPSVGRLSANGCPSTSHDASRKQTSGPALVGRKQRAKKVDSGQLFQNSDRQRCARSGPEDPSSALMASTKPNATTVIRFAVIEMTP